VAQSGSGRRDKVARGAPSPSRKQSVPHTAVSVYGRSCMSYCKQSPAKFCLYCNTFTRVVEYTPYRPHHKLLPLPMSRTTLSIQRSDNNKHKHLTLKIETYVTTITK